MDDREEDAETELEWERRRSPRYRQSSDQCMVSVRLKGGTNARLIDLSKEGAVVESRTRLVPGSRIALELKSRDVVYRATGNVVHASVVALDAEGVEYRGGFAFSEPLPLTLPLDENQTFSDPKGSQALPIHDGLPLAARKKRRTR